MNVIALRTSIGARLTFMLAFVAIAVFGAVGALLHWSLERELLLDERQDLAGKVNVVKAFIDEVRTPADLPALHRHLDVAQIGHRSWRVWIVAADGRVLYGSATAPRTQPDDSGRLAITREDGVTLAGQGYTLAAGAVLPEVRVLIGVDPRARRALMRAYDRATLLVFAVGVAVMVSLCIWVARHGLGPLRNLSDQAAGIDPGALSRRLPAHQDSSELTPLVASFNRALDRVEDAYLRLEGFSADVAHELRTPLAILISGAEVALSRERPAAELQDVLCSQLEELRGFASMVNDMLFLAQADRGDLADGLVPASLRKEALSVADYMEALVTDSGRQLRVEGESQARVNPSLVRRALINLIANALRHAPEGETVVVSLDRVDGQARVSVRNPGPPIPEEVSARMFDRFWRGEASRAKLTERYGLGLAIVRAVARMHGGDTFANSQAGITTVGFTLGTVA
ncbi:MAG: hypothetical protein JWQ33_2198 [Ramlibacter sp.]|nr:hypothetical protein [Ramlibacter sp.]